jgi:hypothetical protein
VRLFYTGVNLRYLVDMYNEAVTFTNSTCGEFSAFKKYISVIREGLFQEDLGKKETKSYSRDLVNKG